MKKMQRKSESPGKSPYQNSPKPSKNVINMTTIYMKTEDPQHR